ncbi:hypothetical protein BDZ89DRAFT_947705 [Hymenopellis radicata]|nr:hypothetical protein BDZ89DRAFT_947705 [Hymenopellis radicata]
MKELMDSTIAQFELNAEQEDAFRIMAQTYYIPRELRLFLTGPGGTGKTHAVNALIHLMADFGSDHAVRFAALTGTAASNCGGQTIHRAFHIAVAQKKASQHNSRTLSGEERYTSFMTVKSREHIRKRVWGLWITVDDRD